MRPVTPWLRTVWDTNLDPSAPSLMINAENATRGPTSTTTTPRTRTAADRPRRPRTRAIKRACRGHSTPASTPPRKSALASGFTKIAISTVADASRMAKNRRAVRPGVMAYGTPPGGHDGSRNDGSRNDASRAGGPVDAAPVVAHHERERHGLTSRGPGDSLGRFPFHLGRGFGAGVRRLDEGERALELAGGRELGDLQALPRGSRHRRIAKHRDVGLAIGAEGRGSDDVIVGPGRHPRSDQARIIARHGRSPQLSLEGEGPLGGGIVIGLFTRLQLQGNGDRRRGPRAAAGGAGDAIVRIERGHGSGAIADLAVQDQALRGAEGIARGHHDRDTRRALGSLKHGQRDTLAPERGLPTHRPRRAQGECPTERGQGTGSRHQPGHRGVLARCGLGPIRRTVDLDARTHDPGRLYQRRRIEVGATAAEEQPEHERRRDGCRDRDNRPDGARRVAFSPGILCEILFDVLHGPVLDARVVHGRVVHSSEARAHGGLLLWAIESRPTPEQPPCQQEFRVHAELAGTRRHLSADSATPVRSPAYPDPVPDGTRPPCPWKANFRSDA